MSHKRSASSNVSLSSSSSAASSYGSSRVPVPSNGPSHVFVEWCKHADRHFATQAQFSEMLKLIKEIHSHLCSTDEVSRRQTIAYFTNKVRDIYFDHAVWESGERGRLEIEGLAELKKQHAGARISKEAMMWIAGSLTAVLTTLRGALRKKLTQLILRDFEQRSPRLSITKYKALLAQDKALRKKLVREGIHGINEFLHDDSDRPADMDTHSARAFKFWSNWIRDGCKPAANSQDSCMFRSIEKKYGKKTGKAASSTTEDENNLDVGNTTFGEGSTETEESREQTEGAYNKRGFDFGRYSSELSCAFEDSVKTRRSSLSLDDEVDVFPSNDNINDNVEVSFNESQRGRATQVDIRKMIDDIKKNDEREAKARQQEAKKNERERKKAEREAKEKERVAREKEKERVAKEKERVAKEKEREAKEKERVAKEKERVAKEKEREAKNCEKDTDEEDEKLDGRNVEKVQGKTGKRTTLAKSTDADKKRKACENEKSKQPAKKRRAVPKCERTVTRSYAKKMEQVPHTLIEQGPQLSERVWTVSLEALELANSFKVVIEDTPTEALKRVPVPKEFYGLARLRDTLIQQLAADGADWGDDDDALYLLFSTEDRRKDGGTTVYLGFT